MGVPTSEVGYTIATTWRETTKVHKNMWWHWTKKIVHYNKLRILHPEYAGRKCYKPDPVAARSKA